jgi:hypothetical protein
MSLNFNNLKGGNAPKGDTMESIKKCNHYSCQAVEYGQSDRVAVPDKNGEVTEIACGSKVTYENWMEGLCIDCITVIREFEGEMSETPCSDYMPEDNTLYYTDMEDDSLI